MGNPGSRDDLFRQYLTRSLPEAEQAALADRLLREVELSDELSEFEAEWIDARARGELNPAEAAQVDSYLAQTGQKHRLVTARKFSGGRPAGQKRSRMPLWIGVAAAGIFGIVAWQATKPVETPPTAVATAPSPAAAPAFAVLLIPGTRSDEPKRVMLPPGTEQVEWTLALDAPLPSGEYTIRVQSETGQEVLRRAATLDSGATSFVFRTLEGDLAPGGYRVLLAPAASSDDWVNVYTFQLRTAQ